VRKIIRIRDVLEIAMKTGEVIAVLYLSMYQYC